LCWLSFNPLASAFNRDYDLFKRRKRINSIVSRRDASPQWAIYSLGNSLQDPFSKVQYGCSSGFKGRRMSGAIFRPPLDAPALSHAA
jgi:hypothetical protein